MTNLPVFTESSELKCIRQERTELAAELEAIDAELREVFYQRQQQVNDRFGPIMREPLEARARQLSEKKRDLQEQLRELREAEQSAIDSSSNEFQREILSAYCDALSDLLDAIAVASQKQAACEAIFHHAQGALTGRNHFPGNITIHRSGDLQQFKEALDNFLKYQGSRV